MATPAVGRPLTREEMAVNPIRKLVDMLQNMQKQIEVEGAKQRETFEKYMCWCETSAADLHDDDTLELFKEFGGSSFILEMMTYDLMRYNALVLLKLSVATPTWLRSVCRLSSSPWRSWTRR